MKKRGLGIGRVREGRESERHDVITLPMPHLSPAISSSRKRISLASFLATANNSLHTFNKFFPVTSICRRKRELRGRWREVLTVPTSPQWTQQWELCCRRRYVHYGILFPILQVCVFVCVHVYVCLLTYGHVYVCMRSYVCMFVCVIGGGT